VLQIESVRKIFEPTAGARGERYLALGGIDLHIAKGELVCLLGPSGCGKSTLLNILAGFEGVNAGTVTLDGAPIRGAGRDRVMLFQDAGSALFPWLTVEENMRFGLRVRRTPKAEWPRIIDDYLRMVELDQHRGKFPAQLSGGMRQRLQIARALAVEPEVLLMDEPFAALDALTRRRMHGALLDIWRKTGKTIVFVTHDIAEAIALADRVCIMSVGPGSRIARVITIAHARPRDLGDPAVAHLFAEIEAHLAPEVARSEVREQAA
jgi:NitT/TauT family transport system ATP-binding protein